MNISVDKATVMALLVKDPVLSKIILGNETLEPVWRFIDVTYKENMEAPRRVNRFSESIRFC